MKKYIELENELMLISFTSIELVNYKLIDENVNYISNQISVNINIATFKAKNINEKDEFQRYGPKKSFCRIFPNFFYLDDNSFVKDTTTKSQIDVNDESNQQRENSNLQLKVKFLFIFEWKVVEKLKIE